jgi:hypothetical protein
MLVRSRIVAVALGTGLIACAHAGPVPHLSDIDQLIAQTVFVTIGVADRSAVYEVTLPAGHDARRILRSAALQAGLSVSGGDRLTRSAKTVGPATRIRIGEPAWVEGATPREARIGFAFSVGPGEPIECVVRIRLVGASSRTWYYQPEGDDTRCWPRPRPISEDEGRPRVIGGGPYVGGGGGARLSLRRAGRRG